MIFECQMCHAQTAAACSCIKNQWGVPYAPSAPIMPPLTEQRVREIVREELEHWVAYGQITHDAVEELPLRRKQ